MPGTYEVWSTVRRSPAVLALYAAVITILVGATSGFIVLDKRVKLTVDGQTHTLHSFAGTVKGVLDAAHVKIGPRDVVQPAPDTGIDHDSAIVVRHARPLTLTVDGAQRTVWVTALTVGEALDQLHLGDSGAWVSASPSQPLPLSGFDLDVRLPKDVVILLDQVRLESVTTAATVGQVLADAGIRLGPHDQVTPSLATRPADGMVIKVVQLLSQPVVKTVRIDPPVVEKPSSDLIIGTRKVVDQGKPGIEQIVWAYVMSHGRKVKQIIAQTIKSRPVPELVEVGTKIPQTPADVANLNWAALAQCESHGNPKAVNPAGYYGLYQFDLASWHAVGGTGKPTDASPAEQTYRAQLLYIRVGGRWQGQWPVCGKELFT